ncbi:MAG: hypothetical protein ACKV2T_39580 [Kofleriaceae bacterium]
MTRRARAARTFASVGLVDATLGTVSVTRVGLDDVTGAFGCEESA